MVTATLQDISRSLPTEAINRGWSLEWERPVIKDPVYLRDKKGNLLYEWDYVPSLTEVFDVCRGIGV